MKQRLLVMNGQKLVQNEHDGQWTTVKVDKAGAIRPGLYPLHLAAPADRTRQHDGVLLHADQEHVYQQVGKALVRHDLACFGKVPEPGKVVSIAYAAGRAVVTTTSMQRGRGLSR